MNPGDSATRQEVRLGGPPTRTRWGGYHLARPGGPRGRKASSTRKIKPHTSRLITFPLLLVEQEKFQTLLQAFVDIPKLLHVLDLLESIYRSDHGHVQVKVYIHTAERLLG